LWRYILFFAYKSLVFFFIQYVFCRCIVCRSAMCSIQLPRPHSASMHLAIPVRELPIVVGFLIKCCELQETGHFCVTNMSFKY